MSFAQAFVLSNILGGGGDDNEGGTVATEALSQTTDGGSDASSSSRQSEVREEMTYDVTHPPPVPIPADLASAVRNNTSDDESETSDGGETLSEIESEASTFASTSVTSTANENTTISSMSMDDLSSITTSTSLDELSSGVVVERGSGGRSTRTSESVINIDIENEGQRLSRIGWPVLRSSHHMNLTDIHSQEDDGGGETIVSSSHTNANVNTPPDASSADMLSFQPSMIDSSLDTPSSLHNVSESSTSLDYLSEASISSDSPPPPPAQDAQSPKARSPPWPCGSTGHDPNAFAAVGSSLLLPASREPTTSNWWADLSKKDWERMASAAKVVLDSLEEENYGYGSAIPISLPPAPPEFTHRDELAPLSHDAEQAIINMLPSEFVCPICNCVIVGAVVLSCGCSRSTCCMQCIENGNPHSNPSAFDTDEKDVVCDDDYVFVEKPPPHIRSLKCQQASPAASTTTKTTSRTPPNTGRQICPSCKKMNALLVPCNALDVAILNTIVALSTTRNEDGSIIAFKHEYYRRLQRWRETLLTRRKLFGEVSDRKRQEMLAMLIEAEEETLWKKRKGQRGRSGGFWARSNGQCRERNGFVEVSFVVGAIAVATVIGIRLLRRC